jgi:hypothetical protein
MQQKPQRLQVVPNLGLGNIELALRLCGLIIEPLARVISVLIADDLNLPHHARD